jgi:hypothetical protein
VRTLLTESLANVPEVKANAPGAFARASELALRVVAAQPKHEEAFELLRLIAWVTARNHPTVLARIDLGVHLPALRAGIRARPGDSSALLVHGLVAAGEGYQQSERGGEPEPELSAGIASLTEAVRLEPEDRFSRLLLGLAHAVRARHLRRSGQPAQDAVAAARAQLDAKTRGDRAERFARLIERMLVAERPR